MKYRKKPVVIEAFRIGIDNIPDWAMDKITTNEIVLLSSTFGKHGPFEHNYDTFCEISTLEGKMIGNHGDYIIQGVNGEVYPCKPDIFDKTYEKAEIETVKVVQATLDAVNYINKMQSFATPIK